MELAARITNSKQSNPWSQNKAITQAAWEKGRAQSAVFRSSGTGERLKSGSAYISTSTQGSTLERNTYLANVAEARKASGQVGQKVAENTGDVAAALAAILAQPAPASFSQNLGSFIDRYA